ncbi:hypothetical protein PR048_028224 [Dryococelus australis]|uniref:Uncharacterized protein n=1 Tax=Dryococelus australis TaxID=614101 RepID=A0ABQ9GIQ6_9NEOP|nr:hypothetical protein PR048_028224 [Dryococelus australis]
MFIFTFPGDAKVECIFSPTDVGGGRGVTAVSLLAPQGEPGSIPGRVTPDFRKWELGIVPDDATGRLVFSAIYRFPPPTHSSANPFSPHFTLIGSLKSSLRAAQISQLQSYRSTRNRALQPTRLQALHIPDVEHTVRKSENKESFLSSDSGPGRESDVIGRTKRPITAKQATVDREAWPRYLYWSGGLLVAAWRRGLCVAPARSRVNPIPGSALSDARRSLPASASAAPTSTSLRGRSAMLLNQARFRHPTALHTLAITRYSSLECGELFCPDRDNSPTGILSAAKAVRLLAYHLGEPGSIPGGSLRVFASENRSGRCHWLAGFSRISRFLRPCIPAMLHSHLSPPSSALKTSYGHHFNTLNTRVREPNSANDTVNQETCALECALVLVCFTDFTYLGSRTIRSAKFEELLSSFNGLKSIKDVEAERQRSSYDIIGLGFRDPTQSRNNLQRVNRQIKRRVANRCAWCGNTALEGEKGGSKATPRELRGITGGSAASQQAVPGRITNSRAFKAPSGRPLSSPSRGSLCIEKTTLDLVTQARVLIRLKNAGRGEAGITILRDHNLGFHQAHQKSASPQFPIPLKMNQQRLSMPGWRKRAKNTRTKLRDLSWNRQRSKSRGVAPSLVCARPLSKYNGERNLSVSTEIRGLTEISLPINTAVQWLGKEMLVLLNTLLCTLHGPGISYSKTSGKNLLATTHKYDGTFENIRGRGGVVVRLFASHLGEPGSIPGGVAPGVGFVTDVRESPVSTPDHSGAAPYSPRLTLIGSQELDVKGRPNLFTNSQIYREHRNTILAIGDMGAWQLRRNQSPCANTELRILLRDCQQHVASTKLSSMECRRFWPTLLQLKYHGNNLVHAVYLYDSGPSTSDTSLALSQFVASMRFFFLPFCFTGHNYTVQSARKTGRFTRQLAKQVVWAFILSFWGYLSTDLDVDLDNQLPADRDKPFETIRSKTYPNSYSKRTIGSRPHYLGNPRVLPTTPLQLASPPSGVQAGNVKNAYTRCACNNIRFDKLRINALVTLLQTSFQPENPMLCGQGMLPLCLLVSLVPRDEVPLFPPASLQLGALEHGNRRPHQSSPSSPWAIDRRRTMLRRRPTIRQATALEKFHFASSISKTMDISAFPTLPLRRHALGCRSLVSTVFGYNESRQSKGGGGGGGGGEERKRYKGTTQIKTPRRYGVAHCCREPATLPWQLARSVFRRLPPSLQHRASGNAASLSALRFSQAKRTHPARVPIHPRLASCARKVHRGCDVTLSLSGIRWWTSSGVSIEQRRNAKARETEDHRAKPSNSGIVRHDSHVRKPGSPGWEASSLTTTPRLHEGIDLIASMRPLRQLGAGSPRAGRNERHFGPLRLATHGSAAALRRSLSSSRRHKLHRFNLPCKHRFKLITQDYRNVRYFWNQNRRNVVTIPTKIFLALFSRDVLKFLRKTAVTKALHILQEGNGKGTKCRSSLMQVIEEVGERERETDSLMWLGAAVAERLGCSTKASRVQSPAGSLRIFTCGNRAGQCRWSAGFLGVFLALPFWRRSILTSITLIGSQVLAVTSRPNLFTHTNVAVLGGIRRRILDRAIKTAQDPVAMGGRCWSPSEVRSSSEKKNNNNRVPEEAPREAGRTSTCGRGGSCVPFEGPLRSSRGLRPSLRIITTVQQRRSTRISNTCLSERQTSGPIPRHASRCLWTRESWQKSCESPADQAQLLAEHFSLHAHSAHSACNRITHSTSSHATCPIGENSLRHISCIKSNTTIGPDPIHPHFLFSPPTNVYLVELIKAIFYTGIFPTVWRAAILITIQKHTLICTCHITSPILDGSLMPGCTIVVRNSIRDRI